MIEPPVAAADALVVAVRASDESGAGLRRGGAARREGASALRTLRLEAPARDPREAWRVALADHPEAEWVAPVYRDASGNELLPTGAIVVRFHRKPSEEALRAFADERDLEPAQRNEFVPEQASFRPRRPRDAYLPDLVSSASRHPDVAAAWPATAGRYRRL